MPINTLSYQKMRLRTPVTVRRPMMKMMAMIHNSIFMKVPLFG